MGRQSRLDSMFDNVDEAAVASCRLPGRTFKVRSDSSGRCTIRRDSGRVYFLSKPSQESFDVLENILGHMDRHQRIDAISPASASAPIR